MLYGVPPWPFLAFVPVLALGAIYLIEVLAR